MTDKSYVGMGTSLCPICMAEHDEVVLIDTRLRNSFEHGQKVCTGFELCPACKEQEAEYFSFVEVKSPPKPDETPLDWQRTGAVAKIKRSAVPQSISSKIDDSLPLVLVEEGFINKLRAMMEGAGHE